MSQRQSPLQGSAAPSSSEKDTSQRAKGSPCPNGQQSSPILYLHIGLPKAASSYLHRHVFPKLMPEQYLMPGAQNAKRPAYRFKLNRYRVRRFSDAFQKHPDFWQRYGDAFLRQFLSSFLVDDRPNTSVLISEEAITRLNHFGIRSMPGAFEPRQLQQNIAAFDRYARRFGFERIRILLMIRRQDLLLASSYVQLSRKIVGASQKDFERRVDRLLAASTDKPEDAFYPMDYAKLHDCLTQVLPAEDVYFMPIEHMADDFDAFAHTLRRFLNAKSVDTPLDRSPANTRSMDRNQWALRPLMGFKSPGGRLDISIPPALTGRDAAIELRPETAERIRQHYARGNRKVADAMTLDLHTYGYY